MKLQDVIKGCFPLVVLETQDASLAEQRIEQIRVGSARFSKNKLAVYDKLRELDAPLGDWLASLPSNQIAIIRNMQYFLANEVYRQSLINQLDSLKSRAIVIIACCPSCELPQELQHIFAVVDDPLPTAADLAARAEATCKSIERVCDYEHIGRVGVGLTELELENAVVASVVATGEVQASYVLALKERQIKNNGTLEIYHPKDTDRFSYIAGLDNLKRFVSGTISSPQARGIIVAGVPGTAKTAFAKALSGETGRPLIMFDIGASFSKYVGESEAKIRAAIKLIENIGECNLLIDEIEKALSGAGGSNTSSEVTTRTLSYFLKWLSDRDPGKVWVMATANNVKVLPPEYLRSERWDSVFFVDLPARETKDRIWQIWTAHYGVELDTVDDEHWTGADIRSCCRIAQMMQVSASAAAQYVKPIAVTMKEDIQWLRSWAKDRTIPADSPISNGTNRSLA